tara:strand:+ start:3459 stop:3971 length:513 start_codon:yes stop_codon:yes gene_type:complete
LSAQLSVWLVPSADQETLLRQRIADIATRTARPAFAPHLTVLGDLDIDPGPLSALLHRLHSTLPVLHLAVAGIRADPQFFKSLYLDLPVSPPLGRFRDALSRGLKRPSTAFAPHLSMAYGKLDPAERPEIDALSDLTGTILTFDRLQMVHSNQTLAPSAWRVLEEFSLSR